MDDFPVLLNKIWENVQSCNPDDAVSYDINIYGLKYQALLTSQCVLKKLRKNESQNLSLLITKGVAENIENKDHDNEAKLKSEDESLLGSPQKLSDSYTLPVEVLEKDTSLKLYKPCSVSEARKIISIYQLSMQSENVHSLPPIPVCVLCDGCTPENIVVMSSEVTKLENSYSIKSTLVTQKSSIDGSTYFAELNSILKAHSSATGGNKKLHVKCAAAYHNIALVDDKYESISKSQTKMSIYLEWDKLVMSLTPPVESRAAVHITLAKNDQSSDAYSRYQELYVLLELANGLKLGELHSTSQICSQPIAKRVKQLLNDWKTGGTSYLKTAQSRSSASETTNSSSLLRQNRKDLDFTDQVWTILRDCKCNRELVECFRLVLNELKIGQIQPMVHKTNKTQLANIIRECYIGKMTMPCLEGSGALQMLVDIGIDKMERDYISTFIGQELVTLNDLQPFISSRSLSLQEQTINLEKLHSVFELIVRLSQYFDAPQVTLSLSARQALKFFENHDVHQPKPFIISIPCKLVSKYVQKCNPCELEVNLSSNYNDEDMHSMVLLTRESRISCLQVHPLPLNDEEEEKMYYLTTMKQETCIF